MVNWIKMKKEGFWKECISNFGCLAVAMNSCLFSHWRVNATLWANGNSLFQWLRNDPPKEPNWFYNSDFFQSSVSGRNNKKKTALWLVQGLQGTFAFPCFSFKKKMPHIARTKEQRGSVLKGTGMEQVLHVFPQHWSWVSINISACSWHLNCQ